VGSIPIARSTLRQRQATQGYEIGVKTLIRWESLGKSTLRGAAVSWPHVTLHCPGIHTYSHTQQFTRINCVIPTLHSYRERSQVAGLDPLPPVVGVRFAASEQETTSAVTAPA
jgi:hypothetical protein